MKIEIDEAVERQAQGPHGENIKNMTKRLLFYIFDVYFSYINVILLT